MEIIQEQSPMLNPMLGDESPSQLTGPSLAGGARPRLTPRQAIKLCWDKYADFSGRSRRSEFWWSFLAALSVLYIPMLPLYFMPDVDSGQGLWMLPAIVLMLVVGMVSLVLLSPMLAVLTRRLHDVGRSGWWIVWSIVVRAVSLIVLSIVYEGTLHGAAAPNPGDLDMLRALFHHSSDVAFAVVLLLYLIHLVIELIVWIFTLLDSQRGENKYGHSPKYQ